MSERRVHGDEACQSRVVHAYLGDWTCWSGNGPLNVLSRNCGLPKSTGREQSRSLESRVSS